jgi:hypothetical protein
MFTPGDSLEKHYTAAAILNRLEILFKRNALRSRYKSFKYHLVFLLYNYFIKVHTSKGKPNFEAVIKELDNDEELLPLALAASQSIDNALKKLKLSFEDGVRSKALTDLLSKELAVSTKIA